MSSGRLLILPRLCLLCETVYMAVDVGHKFKRDLINTARGWTEFFASYRLRDKISMGFWRSPGSPGAANQCGRG